MFWVLFALATLSFGQAWLSPSVFLSTTTTSTSTWTSRRRHNQEFLSRQSSQLHHCTRILSSTSSSSSSSSLKARRKNRNNNNNNNDDLDRWYEDVDDNASPDDIFWEEMERQRLLDSSSSSSSSSGNNNAGEPPMMTMSPIDSIGGYNSSPTASYASSIGGGGPSQPSYSFAAMPTTSASASAASATTSPMMSNNNNNPINPKNIDATLSEYEAYAVSDNWLDDDLAEFMMADDFDMDDESFYQGVPSLDEQLEAWENDSNNNSGDDDNAWMSSDEPWDHWGQDPNSMDPEDQERVKMDPEKVKNGPASAFLYSDDDGNNDNTEMKDAERKEEEDYLNKLSKITIGSQRLERARNNPKAKAFFSREPDALEGYDRLWVSAIDNVCFKNLVGTFRNYGVEFADNFGDWEDTSMEDRLLYSIEEIASFKARQVYNVTGLPCIASRTSWEIEPVPDLSRLNGGMEKKATTTTTTNTPTTTASAKQQSLIMSNPRVVSGYRFNDVGLHVDYISEALRLVSEPERVTRFKTCLCFYDGEIEIFDYGTCDVDLYFCNSMRTFIPVAQAINEMMKTLELTFGLEYQKWLNRRMDEDLGGRGGGAGYGQASMKLRDRVLKEGKVLPNEIVDVSAFMDSMVDVNLMDECASELANRFIDQKPSKILTVATTGLVIALPMAKYLQVPVVYARKERNVVMADTYIAAYSSKTVGKNRELIVSKSHLHPDDRVLVIDDFLSSGASQEALLRIVAESGAESVGVGVLLEKAYDSGRQSLSGFDIPIHSLCRIVSVKSGVIQLAEEEGFDRMAKETTTSSSSATSS